MPNNINYRSQRYLIARTLQRCARCEELTPVVGLVLPSGHESLAIGVDRETETPTGDNWEVAEAGAVVFFIEYLSEAVQTRVRQLTQHYHIDFSESAQDSYWMNHCSFCDVKQGDFELYCEPEGAFMPISEEAAAMIRLDEVLEPFEAQVAGYAYAPEFLEYIQQ